MNRAARLEQIIYSHVRDCSLFHYSDHRVIIKIPLYREPSLVLTNVTLRKDEIVIEGKLSSSAPRDFCNATIENGNPELA